MDAAETPEIAWEDEFRDVDVQERYSHLDFNDYELEHTYELDCQCMYACDLFTMPSLLLILIQGSLLVVD
jgi:hypothetical protein